MRNPLYCLVVGGVFLLSHGSQTLDCSDRNALLQEQQKCFAKLGLAMNVTEGEIQNVVQNDPAAVCREQDKVRNALVCAFDLAKPCLQSVGISTDVLPDSQKMAEGIDFMCEHISEMDPECSKHVQPALHHCAMRRAASELMGMDRSNLKDVMCTTFKVAYDCLKENLRLCSGRTLEINLKITNKYLRPPACASFAERNDYLGDDYDDDYYEDYYDYGDEDEDKYHISTLAPMATAQLVTSVMTLPNVSCYSENSILQATHECFAREGIEMDLAHLDLKNKQNYLDTILSSGHDINTVCRRRDNHNRAIMCMIQLVKKCLPVAYQDYLPDPRKAGNVLSDICTHVDKFDFKCAQSKASELFDCGYNKGSQDGSHFANNPKHLLCNAFRFNVDCVLEVLPECGCLTTKLYVDMGKELNPPACPPILTVSPQCSPLSGRFVSTGGSSGVFSGSVVMTMTMLVIRFILLEL